MPRQRSYTEALRIVYDITCNLKCSVPKKIPIAFDNRFNYDYHFIIKKLADEFKGMFNCLGETIEKYISFSVPIEKEVARIDANGEEITKTIFYRIESRRFKSSTLSNLVNKLYE